MTTEWNNELWNKNQRTMGELISRGVIVSNNVENYGYLDYNKNPDLEHHSKPVRFIYYMLYDRPTFKRRIREILKKGR